MGCPVAARVWFTELDGLSGMTGFSNHRQACRAACHRAAHARRGDALMTERNVANQPHPGACLTEWIDWLLDAPDDMEAGRRLGIASGRGHDAWAMARELQRRREET